MVIITNNQYLIATKIHHISMDERIDVDELRHKGRLHSVRRKYWQITIVYTPDITSTNSRGNEDMRECSVVMQNMYDAHASFRSLMEQIREQLPDTLYLNTALERMIANNNLESLKDRDIDYDKMEKEYEYEDNVMEGYNEPSTKKVRRVRKTKRRSKKVLRKSKSSRRRSR